MPDFTAVVKVLTIYNQGRLSKFAVDRVGHAFHELRDEPPATGDIGPAFLFFNGLFDLLRRFFNRRYPETAMALRHLGIHKTGLNISDMDIEFVSAGFHMQSLHVIAHISLTGAVSGGMTAAPVGGYR